MNYQSKGGIAVMRIVICDDDTAITVQLTGYLQEYFHAHDLKMPEIQSFHSGEELLVDPGEQDIVFLDVKMQGISGIRTGELIKRRNQNCIIFIITSYLEYLDDAMRFHVFRYLTKPLDRQRLFRNLKDALALYTSSYTRIPIETRQGVFSVPASDIVCVQTQNRKVCIHTVSAMYESVYNIQRCEQLLDQSCFFRTHRSYIVNLEYVTDFNHFLIHLSLQPFEAYLARRKYSAFHDAYLLFLESRA